MHIRIRIGISQPKFYGDVVNKARKFKHDPFGLDVYLNKLIRKGYRHNIIVRSLYMYMVFIGTNIDRLIENLRKTKIVFFISNNLSTLLYFNYDIHGNSLF